MNVDYNFDLRGKLILSALLIAGGFVLTLGLTQIEFNQHVLFFAGLAAATHLIRLPVFQGALDIGGPFILGCMFSGEFSFPELVFIAFIHAVFCLFERRPLNLLKWLGNAAEGVVSVSMAWVFWTVFGNTDVFTFQGLIVAILATMVYNLSNIIIISALILYVHPCPPISFLDNLEYLLGISFSTKSTEYLFAILLAGIYQRLGPSILSISLVLFFVIGLIGRESAKNWLEKLSLDEQLRHNELFLHNLIENMGTGLIAVDYGDLIVHSNSAAQRILDNCLDIGTKLDLVKYGSVLISIDVNDPTELKLGDRTIRVRKTPIHTESSDQSGFLYLLEDVTESKALEEYAMHKDRLALLGQFSAGIMHEISKPLTAISLAYEQLASSTAEPSKPLRILGRGIDDLTEISRQLLTFSRPQPSRGQAVTNLSRVVADVIEIAEVLAKKKHITIEKQEVKDICVDINEQEVRQVLLNLLSNAIEATPEGGLVRVTYGKGCYAQQNDPVWEKDYLESRNTQGWLLVEDEGPGFDSVVVKKLGNAYITTKEEGHGLGLAIVFLLLKRWNARIRIYHPLTGGSSVLIEF